MNNNTTLWHMATRGWICVWAWPAGFLFVQLLWKVCRHVGIPQGSRFRAGPFILGGKWVNLRQRIQIRRLSDQQKTAGEAEWNQDNHYGFISRMFCKDCVLFQSSNASFKFILVRTGLLNNCVESPPKKTQRLQPGLQKTKKLWGGPVWN